MSNLFTPRQIANAIDVSESSVKRWCDRGIIPTQYTAGGHRRIALSGLVEFLRDRQCEIAKPELLGLPTNTGSTSRITERAATALADALVAGQEEETRRIVLDLYLSEHSISRICDEVVAPAFERIGEMWECGSAEVYQERQGCEMTLHVLHELRSLLPPPATTAPVAIGGAPAGDQYNLATTMAELGLRDARWNASSLGDNLPLETMGAAIKSHRPQIFWLSCSHLADEDAFLRSYEELFDEFGMEVAFVVGGRALSEPLRRQMKYAAFCDNMQHLQSCAQTLTSSMSREQPKQTDDLTS